MFTEFASIQFSRAELEQLHTALLMKTMVEDALRMERGLPPVDRQEMLHRVETLLHLTDEELHVKDHIVDDALWEHAWYGFTDEWAWYRAQQEAKTEAEIEALYRKKFEAYVSEIDMRDEGLAKQPKAKARRSTTKLPKTKS